MRKQLNHSVFYESENSINQNSINKTILLKNNPFPRNPVASKDNLPKFCLGRTEEVGIIKNAIEKVSNDPGNKSAWIPINGDGGTGKSTIALYIYNKIRSGQSTDLDIDHLEVACINIPADPKYLTLNYLYKKVIEDLGDSPESYPYYLGYEFINKLCEILSNLDEIKEEFNILFGNYWSKLVSCETYTDFLINIKKRAPKFSAELVEFINEYDFIIQSKIKLNLDYIEKLVELSSENKKIRRKACEFILGKFIADEEEAKAMFENLIKTTNLLFKRSCLMVIMDNLENLNPIKKTFQDFFTFLLAFRNIINNCLLITIGSTKFWEIFRKEISMSEWNMIEGFKYEELTLMNLSEEDASRILMRHMREFWSTKISEFSPIGRDQNYPFSKSAFKYIYEIHDRNLRDALKKCNRIIEKYKENRQIIYYKDLESVIYNLRPLSAGVYLFENEINYLLNFLSDFTDRNNLSRKVENGLTRAFLEIKNQQKEKYLSNVEHEPPIKLTNGKICYPDVYLTLFGEKSLQDIKHAEFQVKTYFPTNSVKYSHAQSSIELIKEAKSDYLHFITLSPLENKIIQELNKYKTRIGRVIPLEGEEPSYLCLLLTEFSKIFFKKENLAAASYIEILNKIGIDIPAIFEKIKEIPPIEIKPPTEEEQPPIPVPSVPRTPKQKIYNPKELEIHIIELFKKEQLIKNKNLIIEPMKEIAGSVSVINNAISNLQKLNKLKYSRKTPQGWSLIL